MIVVAPEPVKERKFTVSEYYRLGEIGVIGPEERVELIRGTIFKMSPIGPAHAFLVRKLIRILGDQLPGDCLLDAQSPVRLDHQNEPEPDIAILRGPEERYRNRLPASDDVLLLIEVADSSLEFDQNEKLTLYGEHEIPEVWIVNAVNKRVEQYRVPFESRYTEAVNFGEGQSVRSAEVEALELVVADLLL